MRNLILFLLIFIAASCSSLKESQRALNSGDYDESIIIAVKKLRKDKFNERSQELIPVLEVAYDKAVSRDLEKIRFLEADNNPSNYEQILNTYLQLRNRQDLIKPLLPLGNASFKVRDYTNQIIEARNNLANYLYEEANELFNRNRRLDYRQAYNYYLEIEDIIPDYKDVRDRIEIAHQRGIDYVLVSIINDSFQLIPMRLEEELLDFSTYGLNDFWTAYDGRPVKNVEYNYEIQLAIERIDISPEQIHEREVVKEKQIIDGVEFAKDQDGNYITDSLGNKLEVDRYITVKSKIYEFQQYKSCQIIAEVSYINLRTNRLMDRFPLESSFIFENSYGDIIGDKRALDDDILDMYSGRRVPFPSDEQMLYDTGMELKAKFKNILAHNGFK